MMIGCSKAALAAFVFIPSVALIAPAQLASADVLTVTAKGTIAPVCSIGVKNPLPAADFTTSGRISGSALVNCNSGFVMTATSANGAVKNNAAVSPGFTNALGYTLNIVLPLSGASSVTAACRSALLVAGNSSCILSPGGSGLSSGGKPAIGTTATMTLIWATPTKPRLVAGSYHDTITISVAPAP
jgi:hypothetical protein